MSILIQKQVEKELKRSIKLDLIPLDPNERMPKLRSGAVDIVCDAASFTWERERDVNFTVSYGTKRSREVGKPRRFIAGEERRHERL